MNSLHCFRKFAFAFSIILLFSCSGNQLDESPTLEDNASANSAKLNWFKEAKYGMFIHWGLYAALAGEWKDDKNEAEWILMKSDIPAADYEKFAGEFNPEQFNADEWVQLAKDAGMKYLVITAKHHDGFCMYDSRFTEYDIIDATPFKRDPLKELAEACKKHGIVFCVYYSIVDWHHPEFPARYSMVKKEFPAGYHSRPNPAATIRKYSSYMNDQIAELMTNYGPIGIVWFDGGGSFRNYDRAPLLNAQRIVNTIHRLQPNALVNNRLGFGEDYGTPEQYIPEGAMATPFEVCMTLNRHWGYNKNDHNWKDAATIITNISDIASKGGNYLLNVGPTAEGTIPEESKQILKQTGEWLKINGEAIYGTQAAPSRDKIRVSGKITQRPGKLYLHVYDWPRDRQLFVEGMKGSITKKVYLLAEPAQSLSFDSYERSVSVRLPESAPDKICSIVVLEYEGQLID